MRLLRFGDFSVVLKYDHANSSWYVDKIYHHLPGRTEGLTCSVGLLPWSARCEIAELVGNPLP
jgi:hypothetical protein